MGFGLMEGDKKLAEGIIRWAGGFFDKCLGNECKDNDEILIQVQDD